MRKMNVILIVMSFLFVSAICTYTYLAINDDYMQSCIEEKTTKSKIIRGSLLISFNESVTEEDARNILSRYPVVINSLHNFDLDPQDLRKPRGVLIVVPYTELIMACELESHQQVPHTYFNSIAYLT